MLYFMNDYSEGAHPQILDALNRTNMEHRQIQLQFHPF